MDYIKLKLNDVIMKTSICALVIVCGLLASCRESAVQPPSTKVSLGIQAMTAKGTTTIGGRMATLVSGKVGSSALELTDFKISVSEIEFEFDAQDEHFNMNDSTYDSKEDNTLKGPWVLDLLNNGAFVKDLIASVNVPNAKYDKVKFKLAKVNDPTSPMNGKSIYITGKYNGIPFVISDGSTEEFKIDFADPSNVLAAAGAQILLDIKIHLDKAFGAIDLTQFTDTDHDGVIEVDDDNHDGHHELADNIMHGLHGASDLEEEK
jgi:hypothetical protein